MISYLQKKDINSQWLKMKIKRNLKCCTHLIRYIYEIVNCVRDWCNWLSFTQHSQFIAKLQTHARNL